MTASMRAELQERIHQREETLGEVRRMLIERLRIAREPDEIDPDTALFGSGLGLDSLDSVELLVCLDADFGIKLPDDIVGRAEVRTVNSLVDLILASREAVVGPR
jgi:acyl carrier protein